MKTIYKVEQNDLIGAIEGFPIEVVQKMVEEQVEQGNEADVSVFQNDNACEVEDGGFQWDKTIDGRSFWVNVINRKDFGLFFKSYPKTNPLSHLVYIIQDGTICGVSLLNTLVEYGGENCDELEGENEDSIYYINPITKNIEVDNDGAFLESLNSLGYTEIKMKPEVIEMTMEEIAEKLGIDVSLLRIKK